MMITIYLKSYVMLYINNIMNYIIYYISLIIQYINNILHNSVVELDRNDRLLSIPRNPTEINATVARSSTSAPITQ